MAGSRGGSDGATVHDRVLTQLLNEMDGIVQLKNVSIVAATNRPDRLVTYLFSPLIDFFSKDKALLRPGRIDAILYVAPPDFNARCEILKLALRKIPHSEDVKVEEISSWCEGYSGAEVTVVCKEAAMNALKENPEDPPAVHRTHFIEALQTVKTGISFEMLSFYQKWQQSAENVIVVNTK
jgi:AAA family ATPase